MTDVNKISNMFCDKMTTNSTASHLSTKLCRKCPIKMSLIRLSDK